MIDFRRFFRALTSAVFLFSLVFAFLPTAQCQDHTLITQNERSTPIDPCQEVLQTQNAQLKQLDSINRKVENLAKQDPSVQNYHDVRQLWLDISSLIRETKDYKIKVQDLAKNCEETTFAKLQEIQDKSIASYISVSKLRSREIQAQKQQANSPIFNWNESYLKDHIREIKLVPLRWTSILYYQWEVFRIDLASGFQGWIKILSGLFLLFTFITLLVMTIWFSIRFPKYSKQWRNRILKTLMSHDRYAHLGVWFQTLHPYIPWVLLLLLIQIEVKLIDHTYFSSLSIFFPYVNYYAGYKIFSLFISQVLTSYLSYGRSLDFSKIKDKVETSAKNLSRIIVWFLVLLNLTETAVGQGFIYIQVTRLFFLGLVLAFIFEARKWEHESQQVMESVLSKRAFERIKFFANYFLFLRSSILLFLSITIYGGAALLNWFQSLEIAKTISANLFRKRVQNIEKSSNTVISCSDKIIAQFYADSDIQPMPSQDEMIEKVDAVIEKWTVDVELRKNTCIIGDPGMGRTAILQKIKERRPEIESHYFSFTKRRTASEQVEKMKATIKETKSNCLFMVDNAHLLFLAKVGGFDLIKDFFSTIDNSPDNIFWIVTMNSQSWDYLNSIFNKTRYFSRVFEIPKWSEKEIQDFIWKRHQNTDSEVSFDKILLATRLDKKQEAKKFAEEKYFRILWEESQGNPKVAMNLWIRSLNETNRENSLNVGIPHSRFNPLSGLPQDFYFILASITKHGRIRIQDLAQATDSDIIFIRNVVEVCESKEYIEREGTEVFLSYTWMYNIIRTLTGKNYLYGSR